MRRRGPKSRQPTSKKESKTIPNVSTKISAYDRVVQIVTNNDNNEIKPEEAPPKKVHMII